MRMFTLSRIVCGIDVRQENLEEKLISLIIRKDKSSTLMSKNNPNGLNAKFIAVLPQPFFVNLHRIRILCLPVPLGFLFTYESVELTMSTSQVGGRRKNLIQSTEIAVPRLYVRTTMLSLWIKS